MFTKYIGLYLLPTLHFEKRKKKERKEKRKGKKKKKKLACLLAFRDETKV